MIVDVLTILVWGVDCCIVIALICGAVLGERERRRSRRGSPPAYMPYTSSDGLDTDWEAFEANVRPREPADPMAEALKREWVAAVNMRPSKTTILTDGVHFGDLERRYLPVTSEHDPSCGCPTCCPPSPYDVAQKRAALDEARPIPADDAEPPW